MRRDAVLRVSRCGVVDLRTASRDALLAVIARQEGEILALLQQAAEQQAGIARLMAAAAEQRVTIAQPAAGVARARCPG